MEIVFVESANEFFVFLLNCLQIDILSSRFTVRVKIIREENTNIVETFHRNVKIHVLISKINSNKRNERKIKLQPSF